MTLVTCNLVPMVTSNRVTLCPRAAGKGPLRAGGASGRSKEGGYVLDVRLEPTTDDRDDKLIAERKRT